MCWPGHVTEKMIRQEISRRARINLIKYILGCYYGVRRSARNAADWLCYKSGLEYRRGNDDESEWYRWKCAVISDFEEECGDSDTRLFKQFKEDLMRDIQYPPRS